MNRTNNQRPLNQRLNQRRQDRQLKTKATAWAPTRLDLTAEQGEYGSCASLAVWMGREVLTRRLPNGRRVVRLEVHNQGPLQPAQQLTVQVPKRWSGSSDPLFAAVEVALKRVLPQRLESATAVDALGSVGLHTEGAALSWFQDNPELRSQFESYLSQSKTMLLVSDPDQPGPLVEYHAYRLVGTGQPGQFDVVNPWSRPGDGGRHNLTNQTFDSLQAQGELYGQVFVGL